MDWLNFGLSLYSVLEVPPKEKSGAYLRLIFGGLVGWHMIYMEKAFRAFLYILCFVLMMLPWLSSVPLIGYFLGMLLHIFPFFYTIQLYAAGALIVFWLFDLFTLGHQVNKWNSTHETGNLIGNRVGKAISNVISIPLQNAADEYNAVVETYKEVYEGFEHRQNKVKGLLNELKNARSKAFSMVQRMQKILTQISIKHTEVQDVLGDMGGFSADLNALISGSEMFQQVEAVFDSSTQAMTANFSSSVQLMQQTTQVFGGKAGAIAGVAMTALAAISEFAKQQEEVEKLKQQREDVLRLQMDVETKIMELEATEKRAAEILKVINAQSTAFNKIYDNFHADVFPNGFTGKKDIKELTLEQRQKFSDLGHALSKVLAVIKQEIEPDSQLPVHSLEERPASNNSAQIEDDDDDNKGKYDNRW